MVKEQAREVLELEVIPMRRRHLPAVLRIEGKVYPRPWSAGLFLSELAQKSSRAYFVARNRGRVVGYAGVMILGDEGHVTNIAVDPAVPPTQGRHASAASRSSTRRADARCAR